MRPAVAGRELDGRRAVPSWTALFDGTGRRAARLRVSAHAVQLGRHARFDRGEDLPQGAQPRDGSGRRGRGAAPGATVARRGLKARRLVIPEPDESADARRAAPAPAWR